MLLLCCVNVSGLMMSKLHERQHEFAVRTAIGAGRLRLIRQYLAESFVIALAGAGARRRRGLVRHRLLLPFFRHPNMRHRARRPARTAPSSSSPRRLAVLTTLLFGIVAGLERGATDPARC